MIPDDIRKAAEKVLEDIDGCGCERCVEAVERALMNERERAAKICDDAGHFASLIAIAIRRGDNPDA